jgi:hypothetical protein
LNRTNYSLFTMKKIRLPACSLLLLLGFFGQASAQTPPSGVITYEGMRKIDPSQIRIVRNGDVVQPGSPDAPEVPDVVPFTQTLTFAGQYGREEQENAGPVIRRFEGRADVSAGLPARLEPPFTEKNYLDLTEKRVIQVLEVKKDSATQRYRAEKPIAQPIGWQETGKTRKIAGYNCRKATCPWKGETYTLWYTTELDFTYSPIAALTPQKGVVLQVEGSSEGFTATRVERKSVAQAELQPTADARKVTPAELDELREKAQADFRQKMFSAPMPGN